MGASNQSAQLAQAAHSARPSANPQLANRGVMAGAKGWEGEWPQLGLVPANQQSKKRLTISPITIQEASRYKPSTIGGR